MHPNPHLAFQLVILLLVLLSLLSATFSYALLYFKYRKWAKDHLPPLDHFRPPVALYVSLGASICLLGGVIVILQILLSPAPPNNRRDDKIVAAIHELQQATSEGDANIEQAIGQVGAGPSAPPNHVSDPNLARIADAVESIASSDRASLVFLQQIAEKPSPAGPPAAPFAGPLFAFSAVASIGLCVLGVLLFASRFMFGSRTFRSLGPPALIALSAASLALFQWKSEFKDEINLQPREEPKTASQAINEEWTNVLAVTGFTPGCISRNTPAIPSCGDDKTWREIEGNVKSLAEQMCNKDLKPHELVLVVGSADKQRLSPRLKHLVGYNDALAMGRAIYVRNAISDYNSSCENLLLVPLSSGPSSPGDTNANSSTDRGVTVFIRKSQPLASQTEKTSLGWMEPLFMFLVLISMVLEIVSKGKEALKPAHAARTGTEDS